MGKFQVSWGPSLLGGPNFLFGRGGAGPFFFHKSINDQSCKLTNSWWQNDLLHVCMLTFTFTSVQVSIQISKKCLLLFGNNSVKVRILFDMSSCQYFQNVIIVWCLEKCVILFGKNSLKVSLMFDINYETICSIIC